MAQVQYHIVRLTVHILKTCLSVRFPCSIHYHLKCEGVTSESISSYQLKDGKCEPNQKLVIEPEIQVNGQNFFNVKATLAIIMISANGKVPAGSISIVIAENGQLAYADKEQTKSIQKCPDKLAKVTYKIKIQQVSVHKKTKMSNTLSKSAVRLTPKITNSHSEFFNFKDIRPVTKRNQIFHSRVSKNKTINYPDRLFTVSYANDKKSQINENSLEGPQNSEKSVSGDDSSLILEEKLKVNRAKISVSRWDKIAKQRNDILQKSLSQAEVQFKYINNFTQQQMSKYKFQIQELMFEINSLKQKNKHLQRRERQHNQQIRQQRDTIQKLRSKSNSSDNFHFQNKLMLQQKQRLIVKLSQQLKALRQHMQELKSNSNMQEKRIEYKETLLNDQLKKLNEKYQQSQQERQKALMEMNNMLTQYQNSQRKNQLYYKEKERNLIEQKNKLIKKNEQLSGAAKQLQQQNGELRGEIQSLRSSNKYANANKSDVQTSLFDITNKYQCLQQQFKKLQARNDQAQLQLKEASRQNQDLNNLNKKFNQLSNQYNKAKQQEKKMARREETLLKNIKELEQILKQAMNGKQQFLAKNSELSKQALNIKRLLQAKQVEANNLKQSYASLNAKFEQMKAKYDSEFRIYDQIKLKLQNEVFYYIKMKEGMQNQLENIKWKLEKSEESSQSFRTKFLESNQKILRLSEELMNKEQKLKSIIEVNKQYDTNISIMKADIVARQQKQKQMINSLRLKNQSEHNSIKTIRDLEQQIAIGKQKQSYMSQQLQETKKLLEKNIIERQEIETKLAHEKQQIIYELRFVEDSKQLIQRQLERIKIQFMYNKDSQNQSQKKMNEFQVDILTKIKAIRQLESQLNKKAETEQRLLNSIKKKQQQFKIIKEQFQKYKEQTQSCFQKFVNQYCKQGTDVQNTKIQILKLIQQQSVVSFPNQNITQLQSKILKKRNEYIYKICQLHKQIEHNYQIHLRQISKIKQDFNRAECDLQELVESHKNKLKQFEALALNEKNDQNERISQIDQKLYESSLQKQKLSLYVCALQNQIKQVRLASEQVAYQKKQLQRKLVSIENEKKQLIKTVEHLKKNADSQLVMTNQQNKITIEKQKNNVRELEKKIVQYQRLLKQNQQTIFKMQGNQMQRAYDMDKLSKIIEERKKIEQQLRNQNKQLRQRLENGNKLNLQLNKNKEELAKMELSWKRKQQELNIKIDKITQKLQQSEQAKDTLHEEIFNLNSQISQIKQKQKKIQVEQYKVNENQLKNIKQLNQKIISLNSQIQLKQFLLKQQENSINQLKANNITICQQNYAKKNQAIELNGCIENLNSTILVLKQQNEFLTTQKNILQQQQRKHREKIDSLVKESMDRNFTGGLNQILQKDNQKLKIQLTNAWGKCEAATKELKDLTTEYRRQIMARNSRQQQYKKKVRDLQKQMSSKIQEYEMEKQRRYQNFDHEKYQLTNNIDMLYQQNERLRVLYQNLRDQSRKQIQSLHQQCAELTGLITQKQQILCSKDGRIKQCQNKIKLLTLELRQCFEAWETQRKDSRIVLKSERTQGKVAKIMNEIDNRSKNLFANTSHNISSTIRK